MLSEIANTFENKMLSKEKLKYYMLSAHDTNVDSLAIGFFNKLFFLFFQN